MMFQGCYRDLLRHACLGILLLSCTMSVAEETPWSLRDHYTFESKNATFSYDVQSSEWKVDVRGLGTLVDHVQAEVAFTSGAPLVVSEMKLERDEREDFSDSLGSGQYFRSLYKAQRGLAVRYSVKRFSDRPFLMLQMEVRNESDRPIQIAALRPVVVRAGSMTSLSKRAEVSMLNTGQRGGYPVLKNLSANDEGSLIRFSLKSPRLTLGIGVLQSGTVDALVAMRKEDGRWQGQVESRFDPALRLEPGDSISADPVWLTFMDEAPMMAQQFHSWAQSVLPTTRRGPIVPVSWITVEDGASAEALYATAREWPSRKVRHALVPPGWEGQPGSLDPNVPNFPADMTLVNQEIRTIGFIPGISVDPLATTDGKPKWSVEGENGTRWLDATSKKAIQHGVDRMRTVVNWGFQFYVVEPSTIPDSALEAINMTRLEADLIAFGMVAQAAGGLPVLPSAEMTLYDELEKWKRAGETTMSYVEYGLVAGPIRFHMDGMTSVPKELSSAIGQFAGPIEIVGLPEAKAQRQIGAVLDAPVWAERSLEVQRVNALGHPK